MTTPRCPYCNAQGLQHLAVHQAELFTLVYCSSCGAIHGVMPPQPTAQPSPAEEQAASPPPERFPEQIGNANLSTKQPYSPERIAATMRAACMTHGSRYLQIAIDDGPPCCSRHKIEMKERIVPVGYRNAGAKVWICPQFEECQQWELAEDDC